MRGGRLGGGGGGRDMGTTSLKTSFLPDFFVWMLSVSGSSFLQGIHGTLILLGLREVRRGQSDKSPCSWSTPSRQAETKRQRNEPFVVCSYTLWRKSKPEGGWGVGYNLK